MSTQTSVCVKRAGSTYIIEADCSCPEAYTITESKTCPGELCQWLRFFFFFFLVIYSTNTWSCTARNHVRSRAHGRHHRQLACKDVRHQNCSSCCRRFEPPTGFGGRREGVVVVDICSVFSTWFNLFHNFLSRPPASVVWISRMWSLIRAFLFYTVI